MALCFSYLQAWMYIRFFETSLAVSSIGKADICIHIMHILAVLTIVQNTVNWVTYFSVRNPLNLTVKCRHKVFILMRILEFHCRTARLFTHLPPKSQILAELEQNTERQYVLGPISVTILSVLFFSMFIKYLKHCIFWQYEILPLLVFLLAYHSRFLFKTFYFNRFSTDLTSRKIPFLSYPYISHQAELSGVLSADSVT